MTTRLLLDTSSLTYRAFFALPASITGTDGRPVNAVRGYLDMVAHVVTELRPDEVLHCTDDDWRPAPRVAAYDGYKSQRAEEPEGLPEQFALLGEVLDALGEVVVDAPGWEADDAIGTLAAQAGDGDELAIVTGDRDLIQLVRDPVVRVLFTVSGTKNLVRFDEAGVRAKYGIPSARYADFASLRGDPSDALPGVRGIGEKTARDLVGRFGSLEELVAAAHAGRSGGLTPKLAAAIAGAEDYLTAMREVVPVRCDVGLRRVEGTADPDRVEALIATHRLQGSVERYGTARALVPGA